MFDIITIGTATRDVFVKSEAFRILTDARFSTGKAECLTLGSKIDVENLLFATGGGATNTAVTFARQGFKAACLCRLGEDSGGRDVIEELEKEGVVTELIIRDKKNITAYSIILSSMSGERTILVYRGASRHFEESEVPWRQLKTKWFYITHLSADSAEIFIPLLDFAKENGIKVAVNPGESQIKLGKEAWKEIFKKIDLIILNREEAGELTGIDYKDIKNIFKAFDGLMGGITVMTDGPNGVWVSDGKIIYKSGIYKEKKVVDRTGAGDAFGSGFLAGLLRKSEKKAEIFSPEAIEYAIKLGSANATSVVEHIGAKNIILTQEDFKDKRWENLEIKRENV